jgi:redox-sensitive bicupin YhaK (pirin superfamily)
VYVVEGRVAIDGEAVAPSTMAVLVPDRAVVLAADSAARVMLVGGAPLDGPRLIWWNLVASDQARIDAAKADWTAGPSAQWRGRFTMPPGEAEFIPLPES